MSRFSRRSPSLRRWALALAACFAAIAASAQTPATNLATARTIPHQPVAPAVALTNLTFDALTKEYRAEPGEAEAKFTFNVTNISDIPVHVTDITASCSCTKAQMPRTPWIIAPHATEQFHAVMNLANKPSGDNTKYLTLHTTNGQRIVFVRAHILPSPAQSAMADR